MAAPSRRGSHSQPFDVDTAPELDDDGRAARTGNLWTCVAHIITGVIGAGVLALSWSVAQLGWVAGPVAMLCFAGVTYVSAVLLSHCYRSPLVAGAGGGEEDPSSGKMRRNYTYMDAVRALLGRKHVYVCGTLQYPYLYGIGVAYTITTATCLG
jgi:amino acid permease